MKENQEGLVKTVQRVAQSEPPTDRSETRSVGHGRQEDRIVSVFPAAAHLADTPWDGLIRTFIRVERDTLVKSSKTGLYRPRSEVAYYASSSNQLTAAQYSRAIRDHWGIENRNHYVRDVTFGEDASRIRVNPGVMARVRTFALNILRANQVTNVAKTTWENALNLDKLLSLNGLH